jgi:hypothetical protein
MTMISPREFLVKFRMSILFDEGEEADGNNNFTSRSQRSSSILESNDLLQISQKLMIFFQLDSAHAIKFEIPSLQRNDEGGDIRARRQSPTLDVRVHMKCDYAHFETGLQDTHKALISFLSVIGRRRAMPRVQSVSPLIITCGQGHYRNISTMDCAMCKAGKYKDSLEDVDCTPCPTAMITPLGASRRSECTCDESEGWQQITSTNATGFDALQCSRNSQTVTVAQAKAAARTVTAVVVTTVATNVAVAVGTAVVSAVSSSVGTSAGGALTGAIAEEVLAEEAAGASGGSGASCIVLIGHVQFLNVVGQVGGSNGSKALAAFSSGTLCTFDGCQCPTRHRSLFSPYRR